MFDLSSTQSSANGINYKLVWLGVENRDVEVSRVLELEIMVFLNLLFSLFVFSMLYV